MIMAVVSAGGGQTRHPPSRYCLPAGAATTMHADSARKKRTGEDIRQSPGTGLQPMPLRPTLQHRAGKRTRHFYGISGQPSSANSVDRPPSLSALILSTWKSVLCLATKSPLPARSCLI